MSKRYTFRWSRGEEILRDPALNKDAAFTIAERKRLGLEGLLPAAVLTIEQQIAMELEHIFSKREPLEQYIGLSPCSTGTKRCSIGCSSKTSIASRRSFTPPPSARRASNSATFSAGPAVCFSAPVIAGKLPSGCKTSSSATCG